MIYENLKVLRQQTVERIELVEREMEIGERDELVERLGKEIERVEQVIRGMRESEYTGVGVAVGVDSGNKQSRGRSKTP